MATLNYTTKVPVAATIGEIQQLLGAAGASAIMLGYADREPVSVMFSLPGPLGDRVFALPVDAVAMGKVLRGHRIAGGMSRAVYESPEHASRVAWRVVKDWLAAQLALVDAHMASLDQVMLPYLRVDGETTLYQAYLTNAAAAIGAGR